ncbi:unnamed protein product [Acanthosepion pharaonis]|uniref:Uncharacterized protein n=1 Tax=Acanthosepion pharaonis TaxID=158019 RepID=A0A812D7C2_ACAPH|nr:unnamed protein product [Sepia pharaonis]
MSLQIVFEYPLTSRVTLLFLPSFFFFFFFFFFSSSSPLLSIPTFVSVFSFFSLWLSPLPISLSPPSLSHLSLCLYIITIPFPTVYVFYFISINFFFLCVSLPLSPSLSFSTYLSFSFFSPPPLSLLYVFSVPIAFTFLIIPFNHGSPRLPPNSLSLYLSIYLSISHCSFSTILSLFTSFFRRHSFPLSLYIFISSILLYSLISIFISSRSPLIFVSRYLSFSLHASLSLSLSLSTSLCLSFNPKPFFLFFHIIISSLKLPFLSLHLYFVSHLTILSLSLSLSVFFTSPLFPISLSLSMSCFCLHSFPLCLSYSSLSLSLSLSMSCFCLHSFPFSLSVFLTAPSFSYFSLFMSFFRLYSFFLVSL